MTLRLWSAALVFVILTIGGAKKAPAQPISPGCNPNLQCKGRTPNLNLCLEFYRRCPNAYIDDMNANMTSIDNLVTTGMCPGAASSCTITGPWSFTNPTLSSPTIVNGSWSGTEAVTGGMVVTATDVNTVPLTAQGVGSPNVDLFDVKVNAVGVPQLAVKNDGSVQVVQGINMNDSAFVRCGTATGCSIANGPTQLLSFFGATPIVQPANTTDLRAALVNLGLIASGGANPLDLNGGNLTVAGLTATGLAVLSGGTTMTAGASVDNLTVTLSETMSDGASLAIGSTVGTKIGTATTQKLSFYNATPIVQPGATADLQAALVALGLVAAGTHPLNIGSGTLSAGVANFSGTVFANNGVLLVRDGFGSQAGGAFHVRTATASCASSSTCDLTNPGLFVTTGVLLGRVFHVKTGGILTEAADAGITYQVTFGGVPICDTGAMTSVIAAKPYVADLTITIRVGGNPATVQCAGTFIQNGSVVMVNTPTTTANLGAGSVVFKTNVTTGVGDSIAEDTAVFSEDN